MGIPFSICYDNSHDCFLSFTYTNISFNRPDEACQPKANAQEHSSYRSRSRSASGEARVERPRSDPRSPSRMGGNGSSSGGDQQQHRKRDRKYAGVSADRSHPTGSRGERKAEADLSPYSGQGRHGGGDVSEEEMESLPPTKKPKVASTGRQREGHQKVYEGGNDKRVSSGRVRDQPDSTPLRGAARRGSNQRGISSTPPQNHQQQPAESVGGVHRDDSAGSYDLPSGGADGGVFNTEPEDIDDELRLISGEWPVRPGEVDREQGPPWDVEEEMKDESLDARGAGNDKARRGTLVKSGMQHRQQSMRSGPSTTLVAREDVDVGGQLNYLALSMMQVWGC